MKIFDVDSSYVLVFGAGQGGMILSYLLQKDGYDVIACFDNNSKTYGSKLWGRIEVKKPCLIDRNIPVFICFGEINNSETVRMQCKELGYEDIRVIEWNDLDYKYLSWLSDEEYLKLMWRVKYNVELDLSEPVTFNEKIQWMKLYIDDPTYVMMADKIAVKDYVRDIIGSDKVIPTLGVWDKYDDIDFDSLPDSFVMKCTHDSGSTEIIRSKGTIDHRVLKHKFEKKLSEDYYLRGRERCYKGIPRKIIVEPLLTTDKNDLKDYKIHVFKNEPRLIQVDIGRFTDHKRNIYNTEWEYIDLSILYPTDPNQIEKKPVVLSKMLEIAAKLAVGIPYVRVDLYLVNDRIYFGELTFFHGSGYEPFCPPEWNERMGNWIILP